MCRNFVDIAEVARVRGIRTTGLPTLCGLVLNSHLDTTKATAAWERRIEQKRLAYAAGSSWASRSIMLRLLPPGEEQSMWRKEERSEVMHHADSRPGPTGARQQGRHHDEVAGDVQRPIRNLQAQRTMQLRPALDGRGQDGS